jgi:hypothetical protein
MKSAKRYQFPQHGDQTTSIPINPSEDFFNTKNGSLKINRISWWKRIMPWTIGLVWLFLGVLAFA